MAIILPTCSEGHLICNRYTEERKQAYKPFKTSQLNLYLLLHTTPRILATIEFLKQTKMATRKWHLSKEIENDDEVEMEEAEEVEEVEEVEED